MSDFYEDDEPVETVVAAYEAGEKAVTQWSSPDESVVLDEARKLGASALTASRHFIASDGYSAVHIGSSESEATKVVDAVAEMLIDFGYRRGFDEGAASMVPTVEVGYTAGVDDGRSRRRTALRKLTHDSIDLGLYEARTTKDDDATGS